MSGEQESWEGDGSMTELQRLLGYDAKTGEYHEPHMLRRLAQLALIHDRGISMAEIARRVGISRQAVNDYFRDRLWTGKTPLGPKTKSHRCGFLMPKAGVLCGLVAGHAGVHKSPEAYNRPRASHLEIIQRQAEADEFREQGEDRVERAIEDISNEKGFQLGRVTGSSEDNYLSHEVILPTFMRRPA